MAFIRYRAFGAGPAALALIVKNKAGKAALSFLSFCGFFVLSQLISVFAMPYCLGVHGQWLPFAVCGAAFVIFTLFAFKLFSQKVRRIAALSVAVVTVTVTGIFAIPPIYQNSLVINQAEEIYLGEYASFGMYIYNSEKQLTHVETKAAMLDESSALTLSDNLPRLDGATALYPLYSAFVRSTYPAPMPALDIPG